MESGRPSPRSSAGRPPNAPSAGPPLPGLEKPAKQTPPSTKILPAPARPVTEIVTSRRSASFSGDLGGHMNEASSSRILMTRDSVDRLVLMRMDLDRYEAQLIPDLQQRVADLTRALKGLVEASGDASLANQKEA